MSDHHDDSENPIAKIIGKVFLIAVPAILIVMLGIVGAAFVGGSGVKVAEAKEETVATPPPAPAKSEETSGKAAESPPETAANEPKEKVGGESAPAGGAVQLDEAQMKLGQATFALCAACHGPDGKGLQAGPALMAPSLVGSEVLLGDPDRPLLVVLKGIAKQDMKFMGQMLPLASGLDDEKLAAVLTYVRNSWGNSASPVTVEQAAAARKKFSDVDAPMGVKRDEIPSIVEAHK